jgi:hypothetical protein
VQRVHIPPMIIDEHKNLAIRIDFCSINNQPYLIMIIDKVNYRTVTRTVGRGKGQIIN